jgi:hypothetical protein
VSTVLKRFSLVGVAALLTVSAAGCGTGPAKAGSAAIVGGQAINLETVQERTVAVLNKEPGAKEARNQGELKLDELSRVVLADEIVHKLAEYAAQQENITVDENRIYDSVKEAGGAESASAQSIHDASNIHRFVRDTLILGELARRNISTLQITIDFFTVKDPKEAREMAQQVAADPAKMAEFVEAAPRNPSGVQQSSMNQKVRVTENPTIATSALWAAKPGTVVAFQVDQQASTTMVALVKERTTVPAVPGEDDLAERFDPKVLNDFGKRIAQFVAADREIEVNPRYGVWDAVGVTVKPSLGQRAGVMAPVATKNKS